MKFFAVSVAIYLLLLVGTELKHWRNCQGVGRDTNKGIEVARE